MNPIVIIGTGLGGYTLAREFRKLDKDTPLRLLTADGGHFYSKPMGRPRTRWPHTARRKWPSSSTPRSSRRCA